MRQNSLAKLLFLPIGLVFLLILCSCEKEILPPPPVSGEKEEPLNDDHNNQRVTSPVIRFENPFSCDNMRKAFENLKRRGEEIHSIPQITTTHYYVRFLPANDSNLFMLRGEPGIYLYEYPLDIKMFKGENTYYDATIPPGSIPWQYTVVPVNYSFPSIQHEILCELFLFDVVLLKESPSPAVNPDEFEKLEIESFRITKNNGEDLGTTSSLSISGWTPSGQIRVWDDVVGGYIPLEGAKVRARRWFTTKEGITDAGGYFSTGGFQRPVNYSIIWERGYWDIRDGTYGQAYYNGPKQKSAWYLDISGPNRTDKSLRYATIHRAAHRYWYGDNGGLKRPNVWTSVKISYYETNGTGENWGNWIPFGAVPNILIWGKENSNYKKTQTVFGTTIHEIAHASHIELMNAGEIQFSQISNRIVESWADAVEWHISNREYWTLNAAKYSEPNMQSRAIADFTDYTPLFIDLVDLQNQAYVNTSIQLPANRCPSLGTWDGANCYCGGPPTGETAFIYDFDFYYTPINCCTCPLSGSRYDGANCFMREVPSQVIPFVWNNSWFVKPEGDPRYPNDDVKYYTLPDIETNILKHSYGMTSLRENLKKFKPTGVNDRQIDVLLSYY